MYFGGFDFDMKDEDEGEDREDGEDMAQEP